MVRQVVGRCPENFYKPFLVVNSCSFVSIYGYKNRERVGALSKGPGDGL